LFQLPLPGGLILSGGVLGILFVTFFLRRRLRQSAAQSQAAATAQVEAEEWTQPPAPVEQLAPVLVPDSADTSQAAGASDIDSLFLLAAARLAPEGVALDGLLEDAATDAAPLTPPAESWPLQATRTNPAQELPVVSLLDSIAAKDASAPAALFDGAILEPEASAAQTEAELEQEATTPAPVVASGLPYWLGEPIDYGTAGTLYYAEASQTHDPKAIKFFSSRYFGQVSARELFLRHARSLTLLEDPHLVRVEEIGIHENRGYLVRPYLNGGSLSERLETPLTLRATWRYLRPLAKVLDYLHECQVVHLHLVPENVLFDEADQLRVSDTGLVSLLMELAQANNTIFEVPPSSAVAPEQQAGQQDWRSDLYALGVLLFQMLAGREAIRAYGDQPPHPPFLRALRPNLPMALEDVLAQAMAENPDERYQSAEALALAFYAAVGPGSSARISQQLPG
jgi:hypothetical protein